MANTNIRIACVFLLFFILHNQDLYVQGKRHLRSRLNRRCSKDCEKLSNNVAAHGVGDRGIRFTTDGDTHQGRRKQLEYEENDFRPTSPGHSPGIDDLSIMHASHFPV
ncbi:hypothetical protein CR513_42129, partial [Mucuna pruriens]